MPEDRAWYVLRTQVKRERLAAENLRLIEGVEVFSPRLRYLKRTRRGKIWWVEPLFPGYLMAKFSLEEEGRLVGYSAGVSKVLQFGDHCPTVPEAFIRKLQEEIVGSDDGDSEIVVQRKLNLGDEVEIGDGPFKGMEGEVIEIKPATERVSLLLEFLGSKKPVEIDLMDIITGNPDLPEELKG